MLDTVNEIFTNMKKATNDAKNLQSVIYENIDILIKAFATMMKIEDFILFFYDSEFDEFVPFSECDYNKLSISNTVIQGYLKDAYKKEELSFQNLGGFWRGKKHLCFAGFPFIEGQFVSEYNGMIYNFKGAAFLAKGKLTSSINEFKDYIKITGKYFAVLLENKCVTIGDEKNYVGFDEEEFNRIKASNNVNGIVSIEKAYCDFLESKRGKISGCETLAIATPITDTNAKMVTVTYPRNAQVSAKIVWQCVIQRDILILYPDRDQHRSLSMGQARTIVAIPSFIKTKQDTFFPVVLYLGFTDEIDITKAQIAKYRTIAEFMGEKLKNDYEVGSHILLKDLQNISNEISKLDYTHHNFCSDVLKLLRKYTSASGGIIIRDINNISASSTIIDGVIALSNPTLISNNITKCLSLTQTFFNQDNLVQRTISTQNIAIQLDMNGAIYLEGVKEQSAFKTYHLLEAIRPYVLLGLHTTILNANPKISATGINLQELLSPPDYTILTLDNIVYRWNIKPSYPENRRDYMDIIPDNDGGVFILVSTIMAENGSLEAIAKLKGFCQLWLSNINIKYHGKHPILEEIMFDLARDIEKNVTLSMFNISIMLCKIKKPYLFSFCTAGSIYAFYKQGGKWSKLDQKYMHRPIGSKMENIQTYRSNKISNFKADDGLFICTEGIYKNSGIDLCTILNEEANDPADFYIWQQKLEKRLSNIANQLEASYIFTKFK